MKTLIRLPTVLITKHAILTNHFGDCLQLTVIENNRRRKRLQDRTKMSRFEIRAFSGI